MDNPAELILTFIHLIQNLFNIIFNDDDSSDDESNNVNEYRRHMRRVRGEPVRINGYLECVVPRYAADDFQSHFRVTRTTTENLLRLIAPMLQRQDSFGRPTIDPHKQLLSVLWLLATLDSYR